MSHFYGTLQGTRGKATRCGTENSGLTVQAAGWDGAIQVTLYRDDGEDYYKVEAIPWKGSGKSQILTIGTLGGDFPDWSAPTLSSKLNSA